MYLDFKTGVFQKENHKKGAFFIQNYFKNLFKNAYTLFFFMIALLSSSFFACISIARIV